MNELIPKAAALRVIFDAVGKPTTEIYQLVRELPPADAVEVVRCRDCKHRIVNEHFGERGYLQLKAMCNLDTGDPFELGRNAEDDDWFCAEGERKDGGPK